MAADLASAEEYFSPTNHLRAATWASYTPEVKTAAIAQAKRLLNRSCNVDDIEADLDEDEGMNIEWAIFEQALYMIMNHPMSNTDGTFTIPEVTQPEETTKARRQDPGLIAPEARRWLTPYDYGIQINRG